MQYILHTYEQVIDCIFDFLKDKRKILLVHGRSYESLPISKIINRASKEKGVLCIHFTDFAPNPEYDSAQLAVKLFDKEKCDAVIAIGGGSAIDIAKSVVYYYQFHHARMPFLAIPTTAGSGSEATKFAVIYKDGIKISLEREDLLPSGSILWGKLLEQLPLYQRKVTLLDAVCHSIESYWSCNATEESQIYSIESLKIIRKNYRGYINNETISNDQMIVAADLAGKAINIAKTTAAHAMSYSITKLLGIAHGHAVAICLKEIWGYMIKKDMSCQHRVLMKRLANECDTEDELALYEWFCILLSELDLPGFVQINSTEIEKIVLSVNQDRLRNHPISLSDFEIRDIYQKVVGE